MTIRPVDLHVLVGRAQEVDKVHQIKQQMDHTSQQNFLIQNQVQTQRRENQVQQTQQGEHQKVNKDAARKHPGKEADQKESRARTAQQDQGQGEGKKEKAPGFLLDIKM